MADTHITLISGKSSADSIVNSDSGVTITALAGNDTVINTGSNVSINGGAGKDYLRSNGGTKVTLNGGAGNDTLIGSSNGEIFQFNYNGGTDTVTNFGTNDTLHLASGALATYYSSGNDLYVQISSGTTVSGAVRLKNAANSVVKLKVGTGKVRSINTVNKIENTTDDTVRTGTDGRDSINTTGSRVTIDAGASNDTIITQFSDDVSIFGGTGNDTIRAISGKNITMNGGAGNDTLMGSSDTEVFQFAYNGGSDVFQNFGTEDTLHIVSGSLESYSVSGADLIVRAKSGKTTGTARLKNFTAEQIQLKVGTGATETIDIINTIYNTVASIKVTGSNIRDSINNRAARVTIGSGSGRDTITTYGASVSINAGSGDDSIRSTGGSKLTLNGGVGNDTLTGSAAAEVFQFTTDNGSDVITNFASNDTLHLVSGSLGSYTVSGNDLIISTKNKSSVGTIRLLGDAAEAVKLKTGNGSVQTIFYYNPISNKTKNKLVTGTYLRDSIKNTASGATLNGGLANDTIVNSASSVSIYGGAGNDSIKSTGGSKVTLHGGLGNDTLTGSSKADVFQFRYDGGTDVITNFGSNDTLHIASGAYDTCYVNGNDLIVAATSGSTTATVRLKGLANAQIKLKVGTAAVQSICASTNISNDTRGTVVSGTPNRDFIFNNANRVTVQALASNDTVINYGSTVSVDGGPGNDVLQNTRGTRVTLNGGTGNDSLVGSPMAEIFQFRADGGNDTFSSFATNDTIHIADGSLGSYISDGDDLLISVLGSSTVGTIRVLDFALEPVRVKVGTSPVTTINNDKPRSIVNDTPNVTLIGSSSDDSIYNYGSKVTVDGGAGNDYIQNVNGANVTINGGPGNDTLVGSANGEIFEFRADGDSDVITNFDNSNDTICITYGSLSSYYVEGNDLMVAAAYKDITGTLRLKNAALNAIKLKVGNNEVETINTDNANSIFNLTKNTVVSGSEADDSIYNYADNVTINGGDGNDTIINSGSTISVNGDTGNDVIINVTGTKVTLNGGAGNDSIIGSESSEMFAYYAGQGNDTIKNYSLDDTIYVSSGLSSYYADGDDYILVVSSGSIRLLDAATSPIRVKVGNGSVQILNNAIVNINKNKLLLGTSAAESIYNYANNVTIDGLGGNDTITGSTNSEIFRYSVGGGNDLITNYETNDTIYIVEGDPVYTINGDDYIISVSSGSISGSLTLKDSARTLIKIKLGDQAVTTINNDAPKSVFNTVPSAVITGSTSNDSIYNTASRVTIDALEGNDTLYTGGTIVSMNGGAGEDYLQNINGTRVTLNGGEGNDSLVGSSRAEVFQFEWNGGADTVYGYDTSDTIHIATVVGGSMGSSVDEDDFIVTYVNGTDTASVRLVNAASNLVYVKVGGGNIQTLNTTDYNTITNSKQNKTISGSSRLDYILNSGRNVTIGAGSANDTIINNGSNVSINGETGSDLLQNVSGANVTLYGGAGNDSLVGSSNAEMFEYRAGTGTDTVIGYEVNDTINITSGVLSTAYASGDDYIISVSGDGNGGAIRVKAAAFTPIKIVTIGGGTVTTINNENPNTIFNYTSTNVVATAERDLIYTYIDNATIFANAGDDTIINFNDGANLQGLSGNDYIQNVGGKNVTLDGGIGDDILISSKEAEFFKYQANNGNDTIHNFDANDTLYVSDENASITTATEGLDLLMTIVAGDNTGTLRFTSAASTAIKVKIGSGEVQNYNNSLLNANQYASVLGTAGADSIYNYASDVTIDARSGDDNIINIGATTSINGGADNDNIINSGRNVTIVSSSGANTITNSGAQSAVTVGDGADYIENGGSSVTVDVGEGANIVNSGGNFVSIASGSGDDSIINGGSNSTVNAGAGNNTIENSGTNVSISTGEGDDSIFNEGNATVEAGDGANYIISTGSITLNTGAGADTIINSGANSSINSGAENDSITNTGENSTITAGDGNDKITNSGDNSNLFGDAGDDIIDNSGNNVMIFGGDGKDSVTSEGSATIDGGAGGVRFRAAVTAISSR